MYWLDVARASLFIIVERILVGDDALSRRGGASHDGLRARAWRGGIRVPGEARNPPGMTVVVGR